MPTNLQWEDVALRLALSMLAGFLIGFNRGEQGRPAGMRTTMMVCLAATIAMVLANLLMTVAGKSSTSFVNMDVMRLPLGILQGMGFIGAGAMIRRNKNVQGVTTAATLWFVTVLGLCFGAGEFALGVVSLALGLFVLWGLKYVELRMQQERRAFLKISTTTAGPGDNDIRQLLNAAGYRIDHCQAGYVAEGARRKFKYEVAWHGRKINTEVPVLLKDLAQRPGVAKIDWLPEP
jgi:putative Mg2+ transporter-C (MgtC) family protein